MGGKGRPLFDLNELPPVQDDGDLPSPHLAQLEGVQPSPVVSSEVRQSIRGILPQFQFPVSVEPPEHFETVSLSIGKHPLSCFRPFSSIHPFSRSSPTCSLPKEPIKVTHPGPNVNQQSTRLQAPLSASTSPSTELCGAMTNESNPFGNTLKDEEMEDGEVCDVRVPESLDGAGKELELETEKLSDSVVGKISGDKEAEATQLNHRCDGASANLEEKLKIIVESTSVTQAMDGGIITDLTSKHEDNGSRDVVDSKGFSESAHMDVMAEFGKRVHDSVPVVAKGPEVDEVQEVAKVLEVGEVREETQIQSALIDSLPKSDASEGPQICAEAKSFTNLGKKTRSDQKDLMLGKRRSRQTMFLDLDEAVRQAGPQKTSKKTLSPFPSRSMKDNPKTPPALSAAEKVGDSVVKPKANLASEVGSTVTLQESKKDLSASSDVLQSGALESQRQSQSLSKRSTQHASDNLTDGDKPSLARQDSWKQGHMSDKQKQIHSVKQMGKKQTTSWQVKGFSEEKQSSFQQKPPGKRNINIIRKQGTSGNLFHSQDSSIERLHREATCDKLWRSPGDSELQSVPGSFESTEEYVRVFEPLLFEECRAQLHSTWEELSDSVSKDAHLSVSIKSVEKRERGWYDAVLLPTEPHFRLAFKEGDVAVLSTPKPGSAGKFKRRSNGSAVVELPEAEFSSRTAGIVRRFLPVDTRDPHGAILHFHMGESSAGPTSEDDVLKRFQCNGAMWYLTVLGSLATTQREYVALHAFQHLHSQMIKAILQPKADLFPRHEEEPPAMLDCFTQPFVQHLHKTFNSPQLAAIKWAAMHTAAGTTSSNGAGKRQDSWPFTLVQGPPGTGKTHTVWGMLNVIHLVQYQRYYAALLKKLAPDSLKSTDESANNTGWPCAEGSGSIDEVLQKMDQSLARVLPKLCPKPRMLVCAPSNAATDEMLTRVLDRGFIDGEMKVYRPDVARVGIDTQSRAAQAVSVERRSDQLLAMGREDIMGWLQQLRSREAALAQQIACLQKGLNATAAAARSQGTVGVDPDVLVARDQSRDTSLQQLAAVVEERDKVLVEMSRLFIVEGRFRPGSGLSPEDARAKLEASFANEAEIVFTTVSSSGRRLFNNLAHGFDMVVIDEAAQASEVAVLPPLSLGAARCVLVGDPQQLPATVISRAADTLRYSRSLFERFQQAGCPTLLLSVQYRMHPQIRDFPSRYFYQGRLVDSESVSALPDEVYHLDPLLRPYLFYDVSQGRESHKGGSVSYQNILEAQFSVRLYEHLQKAIKAAGMPKVTVGVITPYKLQLKCLQQEFESVLGSDAENKGVYINTVDAFQGQERDVIMMSCVRASSHGVGFVADIRRMNVALTRARRSLWVMGNAAALVQSEDWAALIADAKERGCFVSMAASAAKGLIVSKSNAFVPSLGRAPGLLRVPRPSGLLKGGPQDSCTDSNSLKRNDNNKNYLAGAKLPGQPIELSKVGLRQPDRTKDLWQTSQGSQGSADQSLLGDGLGQPDLIRDQCQTSQGSQITVEQPLLGIGPAPTYLGRLDRSGGKQIRKNKGI